MGMNFQDVIRDVHDPSNHALKTSDSGATIYAVVNTSASSGQATVSILGNITLSDPKGFIGLVTVVGSLSPASGNVTLDPGSRTGILGNITLSDSKTYIGLTTATIGNNPILGAGVNGIGFSTVNVANTVPITFAGNVTLDAGSKTQIIGNVTLSDSKGFIGLVSIGGGVINTVSAVTDITNPVALKGNLTLSDSKGFIGLVSIGGGILNTITAVTDITNPVAIKGNITLSDSKTYVGLVTATVGNTVSTTFSGNVTLDAGSKTGLVGTVTIQDGGNSITIDGNVGVLGNVTLSDAKTFIGLVTVGGGILNTITAVTDITNPVALKGNLTLSDAKTNIGLVTLSGGTAWADPKTYIGLVTITGSLAAASGNVTLDAGSKTQIVGNVTLTDSKGFIGLVSIGGGILNTITTVTAVTDITNPVAIKGNVTLSDSKTNIGLVTLSGGTAWADPKTYIGLVTITGSLSAASGNVTLDPGSRTGIVGNVTLSDSKAFIGLVTVGGGILNTITAVTDITNPVAIKGNLTLSDPKGFIGLVTIGGGVLNTVTAVTDITNPVGIKGNVTLSDSKTNIGLVTLTGGTAWADPKTYIGLVTITGSLAAASGNVTLDPGSKTGITGNVTLSDSKGFIGLVSVGGGVLNTVTAVTDITNPVALKGNLTLSDPKNFIGLVTSVNGAGTQFIGLVTAWTRNAGTAKTLLNLPIGFSAASVTTIVVPTNANSMYITNLVINSDATVRLTLKSGVTYLTGNASIGVTLNPGGGFVLTGAPDSPSWIGLPSGALVVEKLDLTATAAKLAGHVVFYQE